MGNQRDVKFSGAAAFRSYLYETASARVTINGVSGKILRLKSDKDGLHSNLPSYADTSDMYFLKGKDGRVIQGRVYINRKMTIDFDWGHNHKNKSDGRVFQEGTIHVQVTTYDSKGNPTRHSNNARMMNNAEIAKYGAIIKHFAPHAKLR